MLSKFHARRNRTIQRIATYILAVCSLAFLATNGWGQMRVLADQVGYETTSPKQAIVVGTEQDGPQEFSLVDTANNKTVLTGKLIADGQVHAWSGMTFWTADFSSWQERGNYAIEVHAAAGDAASCGFEIDDNVLERYTLSNVLYYFKGQRASGLLDKADRHLPLPAGQSGFIDAHGGWYDATGDYGIHLSHQNLTSYFNPQQVPLTAWVLLKGYRELQARNDDDFSEYLRRMLDEGLFGADFLVRMKRPDGSFYQDISGPGKDKLPQDRVIGNPNWRTQIKTKASDSTEQVLAAAGPHAYEASLRAGGGMSIAALALASTMPVDGDFTRADYLRTAEEAFQFLDAHNRELLNDGKENIVDDYCGLMAAVELYRASHKNVYLDAANRRAASLMSRLVSDHGFRNYWRADDGSRPYFHPSDAGLPVVSLLEYVKIAPAEAQAKVRDTVERSLRFELATAAEVNNPFGYARQLVRMGNGQIRTAFFFPHDTEAAPWWQGENARLGSMAAAARQAAPLFASDPAFQAQLENYAWNQLHWILGRNPFDVSMLIGSGHGDAAYKFFRSYKYTNAPGAIVNGITAATDNEDGIAFNQGFVKTGKDDDWRWTEEWLPHASWYLYAISLPRSSARH